MTGFLQKLKKAPVLFDGAMGSLLLAAGLEAGSAPELWNVDHPDVLRKIHEQYLNAGADVLTTNSFGGTPLKLAAHGLESRADELNFAASQLAMAARTSFNERQIFVAGNIGPCGKFFPPVGDLDKESLAKAVQVQVEIFARTGVDFFLIETMVDLREAEIAVLTVRKLCDIPVVVTMTFDKKPRGFFTIMGDTPQTAVQCLADAGADVVGANCTLAAADMAGLAEILVAESTLPVLVQPNAGQPQIVDGRAEYHVIPAEFAAAIKSILQTGVAAVGGCCGTTPEHIRAVAEVMHHETSAV